ncbi:MAG: MgtC/SapB family protein [Proteobacteria bacterium]|nr:MgtC/SapB family protein [Pseudomonadota bacterium]
MPLVPSWTDIAIRLALTMVAAALIGLDREAGGHNAGLRTTILVGLAAAVAMIQANLLLPVDGKTPGSFSVLDLMRLPLGILTGVGFIGGGAILRRGDLVAGVTTAGTLWIMSVIGLCFGGGQLTLGCIATALTLITLVLLKSVDEMIPREHQASVVLKAMPAASFGALATALARRGYHAQFKGHKAPDNVTEISVSWKCKDSACEPMQLLELINEGAQVQSFELLKDGAS